MQLKNEDYEEIKQVVVDTFYEYGMKCVPISAFEMAIKMGLAVVPYSALNMQQRRVALKFSQDGFSIEINNEWIIYYNDSCKNYGRINQTIMHEIAHYILGHINEGQREEAEAKFFAKYALAPPPLVHNFLNIINPQTIMETFDISCKAAELAYKYYQLWLYKGEHDYTKYELKLLRLFEVAC